ncbi:uncharacterized protein [Lepeophtheirus salmonis]|uniref:uncharacterized protein isoform X1 n=1 Tax=Lepeophtheirus salmonis TaxID=72036 RepID=UPI001AE28B4D|nr:uncharacterized protein LOC121124270 isoform X1 [Lepeophtheirus salmonis]
MHKEKSSTLKRMFNRSFSPFFTYPLIIACIFFVYTAFNATKEGKLLRIKNAVLNNTASEVNKMLGLYKKTSQELSDSNKKIQSLHKELDDAKTKLTELSNSGGVKAAKELKKNFDKLKTEFEKFKGDKEKEIVDKDNKLKELEGVKSQKEKETAETDKKLKEFEETKKKIENDLTEAKKKKT